MIYGETFHTLAEPGDGYWSIHRRLELQGDGNDLAAANGYRKIYVGTVVIVPHWMLKEWEAPTKVLMGGYLGNFNEQPDQRYEEITGVSADILTQYYQASGVDGGTGNAKASNARIANGTIPLLTISMVGGDWTHAQVAAGHADDWINYWAQHIANELDDGEIWVSFDHEFEVKRHHGQYSWTPTDQDYAKAWTRFINKIKEARRISGKKQIKSVYWWGYSRHSEVDSIGAKIKAQTRPDVLSFDPYVWPHDNPNTTFSEAVNGEGKADWARSRSWYAGQSIGLSEYGHASTHSDELRGEFFTDIKAKCRKEKLAFAVVFSRDKPGEPGWDITPKGVWVGWPGTSGDYRKDDGSCVGPMTNDAYRSSHNA